MSHRLTRLVPGGLVFVLGLVVWLYAGTFPEQDGGYPGPGLFPRVIAAGMVLSGLGLLVQALRVLRVAGTPDLDAVPFNLLAALRVAAGLGLVALYPLLQGRVGFIPTVSALSLGVAILLGVNPLTAGLTAIGGSTLIYFSFTRLLGVPL